MSTYFSEKIDYLVESISEKGFDFENVINEINKFNQKISYDKYKEIEVQLRVESPDLSLIKNVFSQGKVKSHEISSLIKKLTNIVKIAISKKFNSIHHTINNFIYYYKKIQISHSEEFQNENSFEKRIDVTNIKFVNEGFFFSRNVSFLKNFFIKELNYAQKIKIIINGKKEKNSGFESLMTLSLKKKLIKDFKNILTKENKKKVLELISLDNYKEAIFTYIFPDGNIVSEVTLDILQQETTPKKRRQVNIENNKKYFHDIIKKNIPHSTYSNLIKENLISGFHVSVRSRFPPNIPLYFIIKIKIPKFIRNMFSDDCVWKLTIEVVNSIIKTLKKFSLPVPNIIFNGNMGCHLILGLKKNIIEDFEGKVNFPQLYYNVLPGVKKLKKMKYSCINDKFIFLKTIVQALCLNTIYNGKLSIPKEINDKLKIVQFKSLFKLSLEDIDERKILLDANSNAKGVFRVFSCHPKTQLVSIPIFNPKDEQFMNYALNYDDLVKKASIDNTLNDFKNFNFNLYIKKPNKLTRKHFENLLSPHGIISDLCILLRFGTIQSVQRNPYSYQFWKRFYELRNFYDFILNKSYSAKENLKNSIELITTINELSQTLKIKNHKRIIELLKQFLISDLIEFPVFRDRLMSIYYLEFFFKLMKKKFLKKNHEDLIIFFKDEYEYQNFIGEIENLFLMTIESLGALIFKNKQVSKLKNGQKLALLGFSDKVDQLINLAKYYLSFLQQSSDSNNKNQEKKMLRALHITSHIYFSLIEFLRNFFSKDTK